jgi:hypothetical protein
MQSVPSFLRSYFPVRFHAGPLIRREMNRDRHIQTFHPFDLQDFLALKVPPREMLLDPILPERSQAMLYAPRGVGKAQLDDWLGRCEWWPRS